MKLFKKIDYNAPVILSFAFISLLSLVAGYITGGFTTRAFFMVYRGSLINPLYYVRLFTHVLGHANYQHYINNMMTFLLIGPMLEEKYGSKVMLEAICVTALITGIANNLLFPGTALLGASGVVFMMIMMASVTRGKEGKIPLTLIVVVIIYLGQQIIQGVFSVDNISQLTHIIGGVLGAVFAMILRSEQ